MVAPFSSVRRRSRSAKIANALCPPDIAIVPFPAPPIPPHPAQALRCGRFSLLLDRPLIMGVINLTPDSFSDGGQSFEPGRAVEHALQIVEEGADIVDLGGESTRPGATPVPLDRELERVLPVLERLDRLSVPISVDTYKPQVMRAALERGASMINDVNALRAAGAVEAVAGSDCGVCLMHMLGDPRTMQEDPRYTDVVEEVATFLEARAAHCEAHGVARERLVIDPGFGFGKKSRHNVALLRRLERLRDTGLPVLVGLSRKSLLGKLTGRPITERLAASITAALLAVQHGAAIVRVHDVAATRDALRVWQGVRDPNFPLA